MKNSGNKKVLMIVAPKNFEDTEFFEPKTIFEINGAEITVASTAEIAEGSHGRRVKTDLEIKNAKAQDYDALVIAGGTGVIDFLWEDPDLRNLLQDADKRGKIIGAICAAPPVLAKAGLLKSKNATMYPWDDGIKELTSKGAIYINEEAVVSGNIVTGKNQEASQVFGLKICDVLGIKKYQDTV